MSGVLLRVAAVAAVLLVVVLVTTGGEDPYIAKVRMANAGGLKDGSPVTVGGVRIGKVAVDVQSAEAADVELQIDRKYAPLGRDASMSIRAQNLLGQKQAQVVRGDPTQPAPSGFVIPERRVTEATDLDRVLSVLDGDTRARLAIFVNEAGAAFTGRRADFNRFLRDIAPAIAQGTDVLEQLGSDNRRLRRMLSTTDRYVAEVTRRRDGVVRFVDRVGQAAESASGKRAELRRTLASAPGALRSLRGLLAQVRTASGPLGAAARRLSVTAGPLRQTLATIEPFRASAAPALRSAVDLAPDLERLAARATPVVRRAVPTASTIRRTAAQDLPPILRTSDRALENTLATLQNWAGAIQYRDGLSHIFRGEASFAPDALRSVVERLAPSAKSKRRRSGSQRRSAPTPSAPAPTPPAAAPERPTTPNRLTLPKLPELRELPPLPKLGKTLDDVTGGLGGTLDGLAGSGRQDRARDRDVTTLLDFLLR